MKKRKKQPSKQKGIALTALAVILVISGFATAVIGEYYPNKYIGDALGAAIPLTFMILALFAVAAGEDNLRYFEKSTTELAKALGLAAPTDDISAPIMQGTRKKRHIECTRHNGGEGEAAWYKINIEIKNQEIDFKAYYGFFGGKKIDLNTQDFDITSITHLLDNIHGLKSLEAKDGKITLAVYRNTSSKKQITKIVKSVDTAIDIADILDN